MKTDEMENIIRQALSKEEAEFYNQLKEESLPEMVSGLFQGRMKWINIMMVVGMVIVFALAVYCAIQFVVSTDPVQTIKWGAGTMLFMFAVGFIKLMQFLQIDKNSVLREIKRLELQIAILAGKLNKTD